jgi:arylsulfatase A-like enzyme
MDDETKAAFTTLEAHMNARFDALMTRMNDQFERVIDTMGLLEDAIVLGRRVASIEDRLDKLERKRPGDAL